MPLTNEISHLTVAERAEWLANVFWLDDLWGTVPKQNTRERSNVNP